MVECNLAKVDVASSSLVSRSRIHKKVGFLPTFFQKFGTGRVTELVDVADLKSAASYTAYGFDSRPGHQNGVLYESADRFENPVGQGSAGFLAF